MNVFLPSNCNSSLVFLPIITVYCIDSQRSPGKTGNTLRYLATSRLHGCLMEMIRTSS